MNLRQVRKKTKSIRNVRKITKAMQLVSAIKMRKSQAAEVERRPYIDTLTQMIKKVMPNVDVKLSLLLSSPQDKKKSLVILVSSNKGLSGSFLVNLFRFVYKKNYNMTNTDFITVGLKGSVFISRIGGKVLANYSEGKFLNEVSAIFSLALERFLKDEYQSVSIVYNKYISAFKFEPIEETLIPVRLEDLAEKIAENSWPGYQIEPSEQEIIDPLLKSFVEEKIRGALISSEAVEHASRMMAMKNATDNATDIIYNLTRIGNKLRQEKITNELLDMITAKESVEAV